MQRREFIKDAIISAASLAVAPLAALPAIPAAPQALRRFFVYRTFADRYASGAAFFPCRMADLKKGDRFYFLETDEDRSNTMIAASDAYTGDDGRSRILIDAIIGDFYRPPENYVQARI